MPIAVLAWAVAAIVIGSPSLGLFGHERDRRAASGTSPSCLPATLEHSASLPGTDVDVSPEPGTGTANPDTQISFLGTDVTNIREVSVSGSKSGNHHGHVYGYSQDDGGSFVPDKPFDPGERVVVRAVIGAGRSRTIGRGAKRSPLASASTPHIRRQPSPRSPTRRRRPPTTRASPPCPASKPRS